MKACLLLLLPGLLAAAAALSPTSTEPPRSRRLPPGYDPNGPPSPPPPHPEGPEPAPLRFGDVLVTEGEPCPDGLRSAPYQVGTTVCQGRGCLPGAEWQVSACVHCVCTGQGEPACTPCARQPTSSALCDGRSQCPADCGRRYSPEKDCYECRCGVGEPGDVTVQFDESCPPGTDHRANGAFFRACGPIDQLPKGDTEECSKQECDPHCIFVRRSDSGCVFCQCEGNQLVSAYEECPSNLVEGPIRGEQKVCKAPSRKECSQPGTEYRVDCDACFCQNNGVPACTKRDCSDMPRAICHRGPAYLDECTNVCRCLPAYDTYSCTRKGCLGARPDKPMACYVARGLPEVKGHRVYCLNGIVQVQPLQEPCVPLSVFMDEENCNECFCDAGRAACTRMGCLPKPPKLSGCQHGPVFIDECTNVCRCHADRYSCTKKACLGGRPQHPMACNDAKELPKVEGRRVYCLNGIVKIQPLQESCVPDSYFMDEDYCNVCRCVNRAAMCTLMACEDPAQQPRPSGNTGY